MSYQRRRRGAAMVELAFILPALFVLIFAIMIVAMGIFRYQEVAALAREGTRYAATHGGRYTEDGMPAKTGIASVTSSDVLTSYLTQRAVLLDSSLLQVSVSWSGAASVSPSNYPFYMDTNSNLVPPGQVA